MPASPPGPTLTASRKGSAVCKLVRTAVFAFSFVIAFTSASTAWAWGSPGHMAVAYLAWNQLTPVQQTRIIALLQLNPYYPQWDGWITAANPSISTAEHDRDIFMLAATWPDEIKSDHTYSGTDNAPSGTPTPETGAYGDGHLHKYWHFIDTPYSPDKTAPSTVPPSPNAQDQITYFAAQLNDSTVSDPQKSFDLSWLEHLVGDIHQPLHATTRFLKGKSDDGGNSVKLKASGQSELHAYWDDLPGDPAGEGSQQMKDIPVAIAFATAAPSLSAAGKKQIKDMKIPDWTTESYKMAKAAAYAAPITTGTAAVTLTPAYKTRALRDAHLRVAFAGARLAALIQANLN